MAHVMPRGSESGPGSGRRSGPVARRQHGYVLLVWMVAVGTLAALASTWVVRWSAEMQRDNEQELLRVGNQLARGIASYRRASAGSTRKYPAALDDLLEDRRAFGTVRHLRRIPADPMTRGGAWGLVLAPDGGVMGVHSQSELAPFRQGRVELEDTSLPAARRYSDWQFVARERAQ